MSSRAVAYIRVSQEDEDPENQKAVIQNYCKYNQLECFFFIDIDVSGATEPRQRPQYRAMLDFARNNNIKLILFYDLSRLARSLENGLLELKRLTEEGFTFKFITQQFIDYIEDPMLRKKVISDFLWFAELYREDIRRRTKAALDRLKRQGVKLGRKAVPIPIDLVREYRRRGLSKKAIYELLKMKGYLRYEEKGFTKVLSYDRFCKRLKQLEKEGKL